MEKKRDVTRGQVVQLIQHILAKCEEEKIAGVPIVPVSQQQYRTAFYTGISIKTLRRIKQEAEKLANEAQLPGGSTSVSLRTPGRYKNRRSWRNRYTHLEMSVIKRLVNEYHIEHNEFPITTQLLNVIRRYVEWPTGEFSVRMILEHMGFKWLALTTKRRILIENPLLVGLRGKYIKNMKTFRSQEKKIYYLDEVLLYEDSKLHVKTGLNPCTSPSQVVFDLKYRKGFVVAHIGSQDGFLPNASLIYNVECTLIYDQTVNMSGERFELWIQEKVLPQLPPGSVVVMDDSPYHCVETDKTPNRHSSKSEMLKWLTQNGIAVDQSLRKIVLYDIIAEHKPPKKTYRVDEILKAAGHTVMRLPPYTADLNAIEHVWLKLKTNLEGDNYNTKKAIENALNDISSDDWAECCRTACNFEEKHWQMDGVIEEMLDAAGYVAIADNSSDDSDCGHGKDGTDGDDDV